MKEYERLVFCFCFVFQSFFKLNRLNLQIEFLSYRSVPGSRVVQVFALERLFGFSNFGNAVTFALRVYRHSRSHSMPCD